LTSNLILINHLRRFYAIKLGSNALGYMPAIREQTNVLFQFLFMRYETVSTILTSNNRFEDWEQVFQDNVVSAAIIDKIVYYTSIFSSNGGS
jgi:DNA replication protein DnaC